MEQEAKKEIPIHDLHFAAFTLLHNVTPKLKRINNRIAFVYSANEAFFKLAEAYYKPQERFSLPEYVDCFKRAKSLLYEAKEGDGSHE